MGLTAVGDSTTRIGELRGGLVIFFGGERERGGGGGNEGVFELCNRS